MQRKLPKRDMTYLRQVRQTLGTFRIAVNGTQLVEGHLVGRSRTARGRSAAALSVTTRQIIV